MTTLQSLTVFMYIIQVVHSIEELTTGFHKKWFFTKFTFRNFLLFEIVHNIFWALVIFLPFFPYRLYLLTLFVLLMFANGIEHVVWFMTEKKYVPGLYTAIIHIVSFIVFMFLNIDKLA